MGRLIDADALKASLGMKNDCSECGNEWKACHYDRIYSKMDFCEWIDDAPTVHPEPPKIGKWVAVDSFSAFGGDEATWEAHGTPVAYYYCSECKKQNYDDEFGHSILSNYCPNCGAKMEDADER